MTDDVWTIQAALEWTEGYLARKGDENPRLSAQWLLGDATGLSRIELYTRFEQPLSMPERDVLRSIVARRGAGEPLQYITGEVGFRHIMVKVRPGVLIPRPETEVLVSEALVLLPSAKRGYEEREEEHDTFGSDIEEESPERSVDPNEPQEYLIADLCTGSGCIACSLAYEHPHVSVIATDISEEALALAQENIARLGLEKRVQTRKGDLGRAIPDELMGTFDMVVSNPPYIPTQVLATIPREVADFEPALALDGGEDGLDLFRQILPWAHRALKEDGSLVVELHETCLHEAARLAEAAGFASTRVVRDLTDRDRILIARK